MKRLLFTLMCMAAMMAASTSLKAQEVTVVLNPGWTWISCPSTDTLDFTTALSLFTPATGDIIRSQWGSATYQANGQWRGTISQFYPGYGYKYKSTRTESVMLTFNLQHNSSGDDYEYVDLGLPSGTLWATCNVGATSPEEYGDYFAWGEIQPKDTYVWNNYQYNNGNDNTTQLTKYCNDASYGYNDFTDTLTILLPEDDAATANWGADWRMPTRKEWNELRNNTTSTWTTQNGVNGLLFTAPNGNSLFLPASGYRYQNSLSYAGSYGYYWSSSLFTEYPYFSWILYFGSGSCNMSDYGRHCGRSVRAVRSVSQTQSFIIEATANSPEGGEVSGGGTYQEGAECTLTATPNEGYEFACWAEDGSMVSIDATFTFIVNRNRSLEAVFVQVYVDLGLPSGTLWATYNLGAGVPEEYGAYYAWGETQPKDTYTWSNYQYCNGGSNTLTKYCNDANYGYNGYTDNLNTLLPEDDAATVNLGSDWCMPTVEQWEELYQLATSIWTTQNDVYGRLFTGPNGNTIFLPAAGGYEGNSLTGDGVYGHYWSRSIRSDRPNYSWEYLMSSGMNNMIYYYRCYGRLIRPVRSSGQN